MARYSHAYDIVFEVQSDKEDGSDVTPAMLRAALLKRIEDVFENSGEWEHACDLFDTYEVKK